MLKEVNRREGKSRENEMRAESLDRSEEEGERTRIHRERERLGLC